MKSKEIRDIKILVDTREQKQHIKTAMKKANVEVEDRKLNAGDYSCIATLMDGSQIDFSDLVAIERKYNLTELANNFTRARAQFENELQRAKDANTKLLVLIEDKDFYNNIVKQNYRSQFKPQSYLATMMTFEHRYDVSFTGIDKNDSASFIYRYLYYFVKEYINKLNSMKEA